MAASAARGAWEELWDEFRSFGNSLRRYAANDINALSVREQGKRVVQRYFRSVRPDLIRLGIREEGLGELDGLMQSLMQLANGRKKKSSYLAIVAQVNRVKGKIEPQRELLLGMSGQTGGITVVMSTTESRILELLQQLVPTAAASYQQSLLDLQGPARMSYRGTADELRETLREVLDKLAPDADVMKSEGFAPEKGRTTPTMRQKAKFIMKSRDLPTKVISSAEDALSRMEDSAGVLARSVYDRGSLASHVEVSRREVMQLKLYVDAILGDLLQIH